MCLSLRKEQIDISDSVLNFKRKTTMESELYLTWIKWKIGDMQNDDSSCAIRNDVFQDPENESHKNRVSKKEEEDKSYLQHLVAISG